MRGPTPEIRELALRLLAKEVGDGRTPEEVVSAAERAWGRLGEPTSVLAGTAGFHSLLARAISLSASESPMLRGIEGETLKMDFLERVRGAAPGRDPAEVTDAMASVVANFVWLLVTFIGRDLALWLLNRAWPDLEIDRRELGSPEVHR